MLLGVVHSCLCSVCPRVSQCRQHTAPARWLQASPASGHLRPRCPHVAPLPAWHLQTGRHRPAPGQHRPMASPFLMPALPTQVRLPLCAVSLAAEPWLCGMLVLACLLVRECVGECARMYLRCCTPHVHVHLPCDADARSWHLLLMGLLPPNDATIHAAGEASALTSSRSQQGGGASPLRTSAAAAGRPASPPSPPAPAQPYSASLAAALAATGGASDEQPGPGPGWSPGGAGGHDGEQQQQLRGTGPGTEQAPGPDFSSRLYAKALELRARQEERLMMLQEEERRARAFVARPAGGRVVLPRVYQPPRDPGGPNSPYLPTGMEECTFQPR